MSYPWGTLKRHDFKIELTVAGPVLSQSTGMHEPHVDATFARAGGERDGKPILPGSHVAGHLSDGWEMLLDVHGCESLDPAYWLGRASEKKAADKRDRKAAIDRDPNPPGAAPDDDTNDPVRKRLVFDDFKMTEKTAEKRQASYRRRIAIDAATGATKAHALQVIEDLVPTGRSAEATFTGTAYAVGDEARLKDLSWQLRAGLSCVERLGANKGIGFGTLKRLAVASAEHKHASGVTPRGVDRVALIIKPDGPMLFARPLIAGNTFESTDQIPGAAIKGAIAGLAVAAGTSVKEWKGQSVLFAHLDAIRFGHAFPARAGCRLRPVRFPLSLACSRDGTLIDTALIEEPPLIGDWALEYLPDWKPEFEQSVWPKFGWASPKRELRVRTRIDPRVRRAAENRLFAHEMILPRDEDGASLEWYGYADFSGVAKEEPDPEKRLEKRALAIAELHDLLRRFGLVLLGKTKATAAVELVREDLVLPAVAGSRTPLLYPGRTGAHWAITLQTDAVLVPCEALSPQATAETVQAAYANVWREISGGTLCLVDYCAQQKLAGGEYLNRRFWRNNSIAKYRPLPLTEAGSVFVLAPTASGEAAAQEKIDGLAAGGLPLPEWAKKRYWVGETPANNDYIGAGEAALWQTLPYLRQNGHGEIAVNLATHSDGCAMLLRLAGGGTRGAAA